MNNSAPLVDFHCHLDLYPDFEALVGECEAAGIKTLAVTTTPRAFSRNAALAGRTRHVRAALGLHPQLVAQHAAELNQFEKLLPETRYVGEVGLDASPRYYSSFSEQQRVFGRILELCADAGGKILSVHSVRCVSKVLDLVESKLPRERGTVVLHWFTGTRSEAKRAVEAGCYFSINREMLKKDVHRATVADTIPVTRLLTETDGPFVQIDGRPVRPSDVAATVEDLGSQLGSSEIETRARIMENLRTLLENRS